MNEGLMVLLIIKLQQTQTYKILNQETAILLEASLLRSDLLTLFRDGGRLGIDLV
jgi:hypothetical protein